VRVQLLADHSDLLQLLAIRPAGQQHHQLGGRRIDEACEQIHLSDVGIGASALSGLVEAGVAVVDIAVVLQQHSGRPLLTRRQPNGGQQHGAQRRRGELAAVFREANVRRPHADRLRLSRRQAVPLHCGMNRQANGSSVLSAMESVGSSGGTDATR